MNFKGVWKYLYRAVDKAGATVDFLLTAKQDRKVASHFRRKAIEHNGTPVTLALRSVRSNTSTTSLSRIIGPSND